jgi:hypothetical protein
MIYVMIILRDIMIIYSYMIIDLSQSAMLILNDPDMIC